jgi:transposase
MPQTKRSADKPDALRQQGVLNPHPERVTEALFCQHPFFDPMDIVQVKYEMLRRAHIEKQAIGQAAALFGFSRPVFYQAQAAFRRQGLWGLVPHPRGPRQAHKLTPAILDFLEKTQAADPRLGRGDLAQRVAACFGVRLHPHSVARGLRARQKKPRPTTTIRHPWRPL